MKPYNKTTVIAPKYARLYLSQMSKNALIDLVWLIARTMCFKGSVSPFQESVFVDELAAMVAKKRNDRLTRYQKFAERWNRQAREQVENPYQLPES